MIVYSFIRHFHFLFRPVIAAISGYCYSYTKRGKLNCTIQTNKIHLFQINILVLKF
jgi:hypothetical protein